MLSIKLFRRKISSNKQCNGSIQAIQNILHESHELGIQMCEISTPKFATIQSFPIDAGKCQCQVKLTNFWGIYRHNRSWYCGCGAHKWSPCPTASWSELPWTPRTLLPSRTRVCWAMTSEYHLSCWVELNYSMHCKNKEKKNMRKTRKIL